MLRYKVRLMEIDRQTYSDGNTNREAYRQTERQLYRQACIRTDKLTYCYKSVHVNRQVSGRQTSIHRDQHTDRLEVI